MSEAARTRRLRPWQVPSVLALAAAHPNIFASVGVHPDYEDTPEPSVAQLVELAHQRQVFFALRAWLVVVTAAADFQQFALASDTGLVQRFDQRSSFRDSPNCLDFFLSQSSSTFNFPI